MPQHELPTSPSEDDARRSRTPELDSARELARRSAPFVAPGDDPVPPSERLDGHNTRRAIASGAMFVVVLAALVIIAFAVMML